MRRFFLYFLFSAGCVSGFASERFFGGDKKKAYISVSVIRETLFGCREAFNALKWRRDK